MFGWTYLLHSVTSGLSMFIVIHVLLSVSDSWWEAFLLLDVCICGVNRRIFASVIGDICVSGQESSSIRLSIWQVCEDGLLSRCWQKEESAQHRDCFSPLPEDVLAVIVRREGAIREGGNERDGQIKKMSKGSARSGTGKLSGWGHARVRGKRIPF